MLFFWNFHIGIIHLHAKLGFLSPSVFAGRDSRMDSLSENSHTPGIPVIKSN